MTFSIEDPAWLWILAAAIPAAVVGLFAFTAMSRGRRWFAIAARAALLTLLACALAGVSSVRRTDKAAVVIAVDTSGSVRAFVPDITVGPLKGGGQLVAPALKALPELLGSALNRGAEAIGPDDTATLFTFDASPHVLTATAPARTADVWREYPSSPADGSDLASAIRAAAGAIPPDSTGRILLISDGLAVGGGGASGAGETPAAAALDAARAAFNATQAPIDVLPLGFETPREVIVESLDAPTRVSSDRAPVPLTLTVTAINPPGGSVSGTLRLTQEGEPVRLPPQAERITLTSGRNVLSLRIPLSPGRLHRFEATFTPDAVGGTGGVKPDTIAANNRAVAFTTSPGGGRILIVDGTGPSALASAPLAAALTAGGMSVSTLSAEGFDHACDLLSLQAFDLVVLVDVPADALSPAAQQNLVRFVADTGGGLLMVGGPPPTANSFGAGGWKGTPVEPILPVTLDLPDRLVMPSTAVVIVLDSSGSMASSVLGSAASQQQIANRGAAAAIGALDKQDLVGVVEFNSTASWVAPLRPNARPAETIEKVLSIAPGGGTNLPPALEMAFAALEPVKAAVKHIVVLSDGQSQGRRTLAAFAQRCASAPGGAIRISTIAVGDAADTESLERLARGAAPGGEYFRVIDANTLPRIFVKAVRVVRTPLIREEPFTPVIPATGSPATAGIVTLPALGGLILTQPRLDAQKKNVQGVTYALLTPQGEPLLAHWRVGLGQVGAFTSSPLNAGWGNAWATPAATALWTQLTRTLARSGGGVGGAAEGGDPDLTARIEGNAIKVRIDLPSAGTPLAVPPKATLYRPDGSSESFSPTLTAPGTYEASLPAVRAGTEGGAEGAGGEGVYLIAVAPTGAEGEEGAGGRVPVIGGVVRRSPAAAEYRVPGEGSEPGRELLSQIARETGGRVLSIDALRTMTATDLLGRDKVEPRESRSPLWPVLIWGAAGVLLLDIATRRVAWDRRAAGGDADRGLDRAKRGGAQRSRQSASAEQRSAISSALPLSPSPDSPLAAAKRRARQKTDQG